MKIKIFSVEMPSVLIRPVVTEKSTILRENNQYVFEVAMNANKIEIKKEIESRFNVKVKKVRTMIVKGKRKFMLSRRGRFEGKKRDWKKAIVILEPGYKIDIFENI